MEASGRVMGGAGVDRPNLSVAHPAVTRWAVLGHSIELKGLNGHGAVGDLSAIPRNAIPTGRLVELLGKLGVEVPVRGGSFDAVYAHDSEGLCIVGE